MEKIKEKKLRGAEYYTLIAQKLMKKGVVAEDDLRELFDEADAELGFNKMAKVGQGVEVFKKIYGDVLSVVESKRDPKDRGRGKRLTINLYSIDVKNVNAVEYANKYYQGINDKKKGPRKRRKAAKEEVVRRGEEKNSWATQKDVKAPGKSAALGAAGAVLGLPVSYRNVIGHGKIKDSDWGYIAFIVAGLIKAKNYGFVESYQITSVFHDNDYKKITFGKQDMKELANRFNGYFETVKNDVGIRLKNGKDTWEKIYNSDLNPHNQMQEIIWCINSGITLEEIQQTFPGSRMYKEDMPGSKVIAIVCDRSIDNFIKLANLYGRFDKKIDFLIGDQELCRRLEIEQTIGAARYRNFLLSKEPGQGLTKDMLMYQIEENV